MLTKERVIASITVRPSGHLEILYNDIVVEDGVPLPGMVANFRESFAPGDDLTGKHEAIVAAAAAAAAWTDEVLSAWNARPRVG